MYTFMLTYERIVCTVYVYITVLELFVVVRYAICTLIPFCMLAHFYAMDRPSDGFSSPCALFVAVVVKHTVVE